MDKPEFRVERGPETEPEPFAIGMAKLLEREGRTVAAAELRRLHAENKRLSWDSIHTCHSECQRPLCRLTRQRDALLEALKMMRDKYGEYACRACDRADAAIKAVEGEKT